MRTQRLHEAEPSYTGVCETCFGFVETAVAAGNINSMGETKTQAKCGFIALLWDNRLVREWVTSLSCGLMDWLLFQLYVGWSGLSIVI